MTNKAETRKKAQRNYHSLPASTIHTVLDTSSVGVRTPALAVGTPDILLGAVRGPITIAVSVAVGIGYDDPVARVGLLLSREALG